jgi:magnesium transporter
MNEVMKVLTGLATIFIPLGLVASIYGMNFTPEKSAWNILELNWHWGYPFSLLLLAAIAASLLGDFYRKDWL